VEGGGVLEAFWVLFSLVVVFHLKVLFIRAKVNDVGVNKVLVDGGAVVNIMPHFMLKKLGLYDTDLHSHSVVLANYEGKTGHSLGAVQLELSFVVLMGSMEFFGDSCAYGAQSHRLTIPRSVCRLVLGRFLNKT
ncbi:hypothetical protein L195_g037499, partial [Trifolium pratense]